MICSSAFKTFTRMREIISADTPRFIDPCNFNFQVFNKIKPLYSHSLSSDFERVGESSFMALPGFLQALVGVSGKLSYVVNSQTFCAGRSSFNPILSANFRFQFQQRFPALLSVTEAGSDQNLFHSFSFFNVFGQSSMHR